MLINKKEIGKRLVQLQKELQMNSRQFAMSIDADPSYVSKMEKGDKSISDTYQKKIAEKYHVNLKWLMIGDGPIFVPGVPRGTESTQTHEKTKVPPAPVVQVDEKTTTMQALYNLTESNRLQAESSKVQADNMTIIARSHEKLVNMLEEKFTGGDLKEILSTYETNIRALQGFVVDRFSSIQKQSPESVAAALGKKAGDMKKQVGQSSTHVGSDS